MLTTTDAPGADSRGSVKTPRAGGRATSGLVAVPDGPERTGYLAIADFAASLSARLLSETSRDGAGVDDEYLRGYARAMQDISDALRVDGSFPGVAASERDCA